MRWRFFDHDRAFDLSRTDVAIPAVEAAMLARFPDRPLLARDVARAAHVDDARLRALWRTGYHIRSLDPSCVTLEIPPL